MSLPDNYKDGITDGHVYAELMNEIYGKPNKLKFHREIRDMSQSELAKLSGVPRRTIQAYEQGYKDINKAKVETVLQLAKALKCSIYDIIDDE